MIKFIVLLALCLSLCLARPATRSTSPSALPSSGSGSSSGSSSTGTDDDISPEYVELQRGNSRLHRTLFMLDTTDFMKKARAFQQEKKQKRTRRTPQTNTDDATSHQESYVRVRKPSFTLTDEESFRNHDQ